ncbi:E3 ubiquitin/ISG15 ligase TRIM25-like [Mytilus trossulus]|uniref:E3 ubiquitin/ISG15 ligase TRIM25-like n=1 Tax=Mytilus trossulus TaxID=6551 RepID=UPI003004DA3B
MATFSGVVCEICEAQHTTTSADFWCPECDEMMCSECEKHHSFAKATRNHEIISIENYLKLPSSISKIATYCYEHNLKYQMYCPQDDKLCCSVCIAEYHKNCCGLKSLQEIVKTFKASALLENIEQSLKDMMSDTDSILKDREQNLIVIEKQRKLFHTEIKQIRQKVNNHLDSLEEQILLKLNTAETEIKSKINTLKTQLTNKRKSIEILQTNMSALKEHASDLQIFLGSKSLETEVETEIKYLELLFQDGSLYQNELKCDISEKISDILTTISAFGSVSIETSQPAIVYKSNKKKQAQIVSAIPYSPKSIDAISISLKSKLPFRSIPQFHLRGFTVSPSGFIVLSDTSGRLGIMNSCGTYDLIKKGLNSYNDITFVDDITVAASTHNAIEIINLDSKVTKRFISITGECYGIRHYKGKLLCNVMSKGIQMIHLSNGEITDLVKQRDLENWSYLAIHDDKIYQTTSNYFVRCYTMTGEQLWQHILPKSEGLARGITVDSNGIVYVAKYNTNSIALLSPDGQRCRHLQISDAKQLWGLHFNAITNLFTVGCWNGTIVLYDISYSD